METFHVPGAFTNTPHFNTSAHSMATQSSDQDGDSLKSLKSREGKFDKLGLFLNADPEKIKQLKQYKQVSQAQLYPGSIIYVRDVDLDATTTNTNSESRLHNRILVVKKINPSSMICFTFCRHTPPLCYAEDAQSHWCVVKSGGSGDPRIKDPKSNPAKLEPLEVQLSLDLSPKDNITLNVRDPWNVENEVHVAKLGQVSAESWRRCKKRMNEIFADDQSDDEINGSLSPTGGDGARVAKHHRSKSDVGHVGSHARPREKGREYPLWIRVRDVRS